jgi:hypothetical protein
LPVYLSLSTLFELPFPLYFLKHFVLSFFFFYLQASFISIMTTVRTSIRFLESMDLVYSKVDNYVQRIASIVLGIKKYELSMHTKLEAQ